MKIGRKRPKVYTIVVVAAVLAVAFSGYSIFHFYSQKNAEKVTDLSLHSIYENYTVDPFVNTSGVMFTVTFNLSDFPGGTIELTPNIVLYSTHLPDSYAKNSSMFNLTRNGSYGIDFTSTSSFAKTNHSRVYSGQEDVWLIQNESSFSAAGSVLQWNDSGIWSIDSGKLLLPPGTYSVTSRIWFMSLQPTQEQLNLTYADAWVSLYSFQVSAWISHGSSFTLSEANVT